MRDFDSKHFDTYYAAMFEKDAAFDDVFFTAVKTTGVFCRPTCSARKPKRENVEFFATADDAISHGYRACKVCRPLEEKDRMPESIASIVEELTKNPSLRLRDSDLAAFDIEPSAVRRWFLKHRGMTFQAFQRTMRMNLAAQRIRDGEMVTAVAFDSGYESLSGFNQQFKSQFGASPTQMLSGVYSQ